MKENSSAGDSVPSRDSQRVEAAKLMKAVRFVRVILYLGLAKSSFATVFVAAFVLDINSSWRSDGVLVVGLGGVVGMNILAIKLANTRPVPILVSLALLYSWILIEWVIGPIWLYSPGEFPIGALAWAALCWFLVYRAVQLVRYTTANPDSYVARMMQKDLPEGIPGHQGRAIEEERRRRAREDRVLRWCRVPIAVALVGGLFTLWLDTGH